MSDLSALKIDRKPTAAPASRGRKPHGAWPLRIVVLLVLAALGYLFHRPVMGFVDRLRLPKVAVAVVALSHPAEVGAVQGTAANGYIVAARRAALSADTPGRIVELNVTEGSKVKKGEVVARLYADEYAAAVALADADVVAARADAARATAGVASARIEVLRRQRTQAAAGAGRDEASAQAELARRRLERARRLFRDQLLAAAEFDAAEAEHTSRLARVASADALAKAAEAEVEDASQQLAVATAASAAAQARVTVAEARAQQAKATLTKTDVRAPFDGIVVLKDAEVGEVVSPNSQSGGSARGSVCTMVDFASLEVQADVPETSIASVRVDAPADIFLDAYPGKLYRGRVARIWPTADRQKASIEVRIAFEQRDEDLRPNMGVRVVFRNEPRAGAAVAAPQQQRKQILIDERALVESASTMGVFVLERDTVRYQALRLGERRAGQVAVLEGLGPGQRIVVAPPADLRDGTRVLVADK
ncbi:MAG: efflux RND transporter periplasmic adaptor subunit [Planctomycetes bacterium]|nr:efflux RND transporter periplasmic adaptor subunit [Planctomycetota bacterium]